MHERKEPMHHQGSCHCGAIAFDLEADIDEVYDCNCSMCRRRGGLLWFGPASVFALKTPDAALATYRFNKEHIGHRFCATCGIAPYSQAVHPKTGEDTVAVNVRCIPTLDLSTLKVTTIDGASL